MNRLYQLTIMMLLTCCVIPFSNAIAGTGTISGRMILENGKPAAAGFVLLYKKKSAIPFMPQKYRFEPEEAMFIEGDGRFKLRVEEGSYFLEAIYRSSHDIVGPPREGEYQAISLDKNGAPKEHIIEPGKEKNIGDIVASSPYKGMTADDIDTGVTGKVLRGDGRPVADAVVFAYTDRSMTGNAMFASDKTGKDGRYVLGLYAGGTYYLGVRVIKEAFPEIIIVYGGTEAAPLIVETGQVISGIDIDY